MQANFSLCLIPFLFTLKLFTVSAQMQQSQRSTQIKKIIIVHFQKFQKLKKHEKKKKIDVKALYIIFI
jgi:hypothetical protein